MRIETGLGGKSLAAEAAAGEPAMQPHVVHHRLPVGELLPAYVTLEESSSAAAALSSHPAAAGGGI